MYGLYHTYIKKYFPDVSKSTANMWAANALIGKGPFANMIIKMGCRYFINMIEGKALLESNKIFIKRFNENSEDEVVKKLFKLIDRF